MSLDFALDRLYSTGWSDLDSSGCEHHTDGRAYPSLARVSAEFARAGYALNVGCVEPFEVFRASWADADGRSSGAVVGSTALEAAVYALAQMRAAAAAAASTAQSTAQ